MASGDLYAPILGPVGDPGLPFTYPPIAAVLFVPLLALPFTVSFIVLTAATVALTHFVVCDVAVRVGWLGQFSRSAWLLTPLVLATAPFLDTLTYGQINVVLMAVCYLASTRCRNQWGFGLAVGLTAAVKLTPLALLLLPLVLWRWITIVAAGLSFVVPQIVTLVTLPRLTTGYWGSVIWEPSRVGNLAYVDNLSLRGIVERVGASAWVWILAVVLTVGLAAMAIQRRRHARPAALLGFAAGCMVLISPVTWVHHLVWWPHIAATWTADTPRRPITVVTVLFTMYLAVSPKHILDWLSLSPGSAFGQLLASAPGILVLIGTILSVLLISPNMSRAGLTSEGQTSATLQKG
ncbi:hypothetical protein BW733_12530 [Tessaracoccus flavescens]|uniref:DUF2029 domain-containing protein n=1 Tax=Tessaracoccus flavescens TaxID=399497 RepID=A0A1Q2CZG2_9ACTN|nr:hypothetical protein BW733_12530 [Tessaracoccus flavescens]